MSAPKAANKVLAKIWRRIENAFSGPDAEEAEGLGGGQQIFGHPGHPLVTVSTTVAKANPLEQKTLATLATCEDKNEGSHEEAESKTDGVGSDAKGEARVISYFEVAKVAKVANSTEFLGFSLATDPVAGGQWWPKPDAGSAGSEDKCQPENDSPGLAGDGHQGEVESVLAPSGLAVRADAPTLSEPLVLDDGRWLHRFRSAEIPPAPSALAAALVNGARQRRVVLVADGATLIIVEPEFGALPLDTLACIRSSAGEIIALLRGEHRRRTDGQAS